MSVSGLVEIPYEGEFSLVDTLKSGQLFHWESALLDGCAGFAGCAGGKGPSFITQSEDGRVYGLSNDETLLSGYFGLDHAMDSIHATFPQGDEVLAEAIVYCPGIRLARQPMWECLATFITSSLKQVAHIRAISMKLRRRYGVAHELAGQTFYSYPEPRALASAGEEALRECSLGYRAKSLHLAAQAIESGSFDLAQIESEEDPEKVMAALLELHGVGEKIANCVLLFSGGFHGAFPIDVWIERILRENYRKRVRGQKLQKWAVDYFGENAGYAQQYLFHFARKTL
ncbi:hypothetical protein N9B73_00325 [Verrucomicrobiales bacterium]|jgi:N-glycosylase/DNA lyase|nr:hypothetical protein [Verrucomicrobiales bacterium]